MENRQEIKQHNYGAGSQSLNRGEGTQREALMRLGLICGKYRGSADRVTAWQGSLYLCFEQESHHAGVLCGSLLEG
jgi:hypothetical protein